MQGLPALRRAGVPEVVIKNWEEVTHPTPSLVRGSVSGGFIPFRKLECFDVALLRRRGGCGDGDVDRTESRSRSLSLSLSLIAESVAGATEPTTAFPTSAVAPPEVDSPQASSIRFVRNVGQFDPRVHYWLPLGSATVWFLEDRQIHTLHRADYPDAVRFGPPSPENRPLVRRHTLSLTFLGSNLGCEVEPEVPRSSYSNFYIGNDPSRHRAEVPEYVSVIYRDLYPGIDVRYYASGGDLVHDFLLRPGADPASIRVQADGVDSVAVLPDGTLALQTSLGTVEQRPPIVYQERGGQLVLVEARFELVGLNTYGFVVEGTFDPTLPLVIDPRFIYGTYFGGDGEENHTYVDVDQAGNAYLASTTHSEFGQFPGAINACSPYCASAPSTGGGVFGNAVVSKLRPLGQGTNDLIYTTYVGGALGDAVYNLVVTSDGRPYVVGAADSDDFPTFGFAPAQSCFGNSVDAFVIALNLNGMLAHSTCVGSVDTDYGNGIALFQEPVARSDCRPVNPQNPGGASVACGTGESDPGLYVYVGGYTFLQQENTFPWTESAYDIVHRGAADSFLAVLNPDLGCVCYGTLLGGSGVDVVYDVITDSTGDAYIAGATGCGQGWHNGVISVPSGQVGFPVKNAWDATFEGSCTGGGAYPEGYIAKIRPRPLTPTADQLIFSTFCGGGAYLNPAGLAWQDFGACEAEDEYCFDLALSGEVLYVVGATPAANFPATQSSCPQPADPGCLPSSDEQYPLSPAEGGVHAPIGDPQYDGFLVAMDRISGARIFSTTFGGLQEAASIDVREWVYGVRVDPHGGVWVAGQTTADDLPTDPILSYQPGHAGDGDMFLARIRHVTSPTRSTVLDYCTYIGGTRYENQWGMAMGSSGIIYISGETSSANFDVTPGAYRGTINNGPVPDSCLVLFDTADTFIRGDVDLNGVVDAADYQLLQDVVAGKASASCPDAADVTDDGLIDGVDVAKLFDYLNYPPGGLPDPFPACGRDPTVDTLPFCVGNGQVCP